MPQLSRHSEHALNPIEEEDKLSYKLAAAGRKIIKLNQGNPPIFFPTPKYTVDAYVKALRSGRTGYTFHAGIPELREAVSMRHNRLYHADATEDDVVITQGVSEAILCLNSLFINQGDRAVLFRPYYPLYNSALKVSGGQPVFVGLTEDGGYAFDSDALGKALRKGGRHAKFMIFSNPCNPTGTVMGRKDLVQIAEAAKDNGVFVISDEIYDEIVYNGAKFTSFSEVSKGIPSAILGGASKNFDATGFRIGYALINGRDKFSRQVKDKLCDYAKMRLSSNTPAEYAFADSINSASKHKAAITSMVSQIEKRVNFAHRLINRSNYLSESRPNGAFYLFPKVEMDALDLKDDRELTERLLIEEGVQISRGSGFGAPGHIRIVALAPQGVLEHALRKIDKFFVRHSK
jgi:aspartate/methionine/tyrosine aminotransferase